MSSSVSLPSAQAERAGDCLNCGTPLTGAYCASCGQKEPHRDPTLREFIAETTQELTDLDGKVPRTLKTLLLEPGRLTLDFLAGRRARWLPPLRLYLICSVAYFLTDAMSEAITHRSARAFAAVTQTVNGRTTLTPEGRRELQSSTPARVFGMERMERAITNNAQFNRAIDTAYPKAVFLLLPLFALLTNVAWRRKQPRYPMHLYLALHLHAAFFAAVTVSVLLAGFTSSASWLAIAGGAAMLYCIWHLVVAMRRVFRDSWIVTLAKTAAIAVVYFAALFALSLGILGYALATT